MILLMFSGGLDSTTALYKLLKETDEQVYAHFIDYINRENRFNAERYAVNNIIKYCKNIRDFKFTTGVKDYSYLNCVPWDHFVVAFEAAVIVACDKNIKKVAWGLEDFKYPNTNGWVYKWTHAQALHDMAIFITRERPEWVFPVSTMTKKEQFEYLPRELFDLTWSCRWPTKKDGMYIPCTNCKTCKRFQTENIPYQPSIPI